MAKTLYFPTSKPKQLITPKELKDKFPLTIPQKKFIEETRHDIRKILDGSDPRLLLIVGPCSIHDISAAIEYAGKLQTLAQEVSKSFLVVMRVYFEKSRTSLGWKGMMHDPHLDGSNDVNKGLQKTRALLLDLINMGIPAGCEILDPISVNYTSDLLSWCSIGARTTSSQIHRQLASNLNIPVGFKNNTDGNIDIAVNGILASSVPHTYIGTDENGMACIVHSKGNPNCHTVLRGGRASPNYDSQSIQKVLDLLQKENLPQRVIVDCSHDNSGSQHQKQKEVFKNVVDQYCSGRKEIKGLILESNLFSGSQSIADNEKELIYGVSITDSCLDWKETKSAILEAKIKLEQTEKRVAIAQTYA